MDENKFNTNAPAPQRSLLGKILNVVLCVFLVIALAFLAVRIVFRPVYVNGHSMDETLFDGEAVAIGAFDKNVKTGKQRSAGRRTEPNNKKSGGYRRR